MDAVAWKPFFSNPIVERYRRTDFSTSQIWVYLCVYLCVAGATFLIAVFDTFSLANRTAAARFLFYWFMGIELVLLWMWPFAKCGSALTDEVTGKTSDFLRILPIPPWKKALGIIVGRSLIPLGLAVVNLLPLGLFATAGAVNPEIILQLAVTAVSVFFFASVTASLYSTLDRSDMRKIVFLPAILAMFGIIPVAIETFSELVLKNNLACLTLNFFRTSCSFLVILNLGTCYFSIWLFRSLSNRIERPGGPLMNKFDSAMFLTGLCVMLLGLMTAGLSGAAWNGESAKAAGMFWFLSAGCLFAMPAVAFKFVEDYAEEAGGAVNYDRSRDQIEKRLVRNSNLSTALRLFGVWASFAMFAGIVSKIGAVSTMEVIIEWLLFFALFVLVVEIDLLFRWKVSAIRYITVAIILAVPILPFIAAKVTGSDFPLSLSVAGLLSHTFSTSRHAWNSVYPLSILVNLPLSLLLGSIVLRRYRELCTDAIAEDAENRTNHLENLNLDVI